MDRVGVDVIVVSEIEGKLQFGRFRRMGGVMSTISCRIWLIMMLSLSFLDFLLL